MSNHPQAFFHPQQLALAFMQCTARALTDQQIDQQEHTWLESLVTHTTTGDSARVDLLGVDDGSDPPALSATLMFSHPGSTSHRIFLYSPVYGLEAFDDRTAVDDTLHHRITRHDTTLEATHMQSDVFTALMNSYLNVRARRLARMAEELARLPALDAQIGNSTTTAGSATAYNKALHQFWKTSTAGAKHLHQLASKAFAEGFYQDLAQTRLADPGNPLLSLDPQWPALMAPVSRCEKILVRLNSEWVELAGAFTFSHSSRNALMLYWPPTGLHAFAGEGALHAYLDTQALQIGLPLKYAAQWRQNDAHVYQGQAIKESVFVDRLDSIVTLQELNLAYTLSIASNDATQARIAVDDALDVRTLIDRRLASLDPTLRWTRGVVAPARQPPSIDPVIKPLLQSIDRLAWLANVRDAIYQISPGVLSVAQGLLQPALAVFDDNLQAHTTLLHQDDQRASGSNLLELLFQRISGFSRVPLRDTDMFSNTAGQPLLSLAPAAVEQLLNDAEKAFANSFAGWLKGSDTLSLCLDGRWLSLPALLRTNLEDGLRLEMALHDYFKTLPPALMKRLKQALERPLAGQPQAMGTQSLRVSGLQLAPARQTPGIRLKLAFVIEQPDSSDHALLFWSPLEGLKAYIDLQQLSNALVSNMTSGPRRDAWLNLLPAAQVGEWNPWLEASVNSHLSISTWPIDGDLLDEMQKTLIRAQNDDAQQALALAISDQDRPGIFAPLIDTLHTYDGICDYFEAQSLHFADLHTREVLPDWLDLATATDFVAFSALLQRTQETLSPANRYLSGIPTIADFTRQHLQARLARDFASHPIDPDTVIITLKDFTAAPGPTGEVPWAIPAATLEIEQSLTQSAIDHFSKNTGAVMHIRLADGTDLPAGLTPDYVRTLVRELDIGGQYQTLLSKEFAPENKQFNLRQARFSAMASAMLQLSTLQHVLQDGWNRATLGCVDAILEMPDGLARQPVAGQDIAFSRLQLCAAADAAPDTVTGVYVICPVVENQGPVILFTAYASQHSLRLYPGRAELIAAVQTDPVLQSQLLERLKPEARRTYDNGGWLEPHVRWSAESSFDIVPTAPGPARLHLVPLKENALTIMFEDMIEHLKAIAATQAISSAQAQWKSFTDLMTLGVEQASAFLPGRLAILVNLWQAKSWMGAATDAAHRSQWGKALSEFATALASMVSTRSAEQPDEPARSSVAHDLPTTLDSARRLRSYEVRTLSLANLVKDLALPVYREGQTVYAAVQGRVYRIVQQGEDWYIFTGQSQPGPKIRLDAERHWVLDNPAGLRGGGIGSSKIDIFGTDAADIDEALEDRFTVTATGMPQIKAADRIKARQIQAAHALALRYLRTCLVNLDADRRAGFIPHTSDIILQAVFGFPATPTVVAQRLRNMVADIYVDMLSPSLSPKTSTRFVTGTHKSSDASSDAFVYRNDPSRRIFLADSFFSYLPVAYPMLETQTGGFDPRTHFQATVLIHELSHLNNRTSDIAYLNSAAPFADLISRMHPQAQAQLLDAQNRRLSLYTPRDRLFKMNRNGTWQDLGDDEGYGLSAVLKLTNTRNLEQARDVFYNDPIKRCNVILANADTIALLVTKLGRVPFHSTAV
ncbi:hypothetical protein PS3A_06740 [Pseudomonas sp. 3A(2025)]